MRDLPDCCHVPTSVFSIANDVIALVENHRFVHSGAQYVRNLLCPAVRQTTMSSTADPSSGGRSVAAVVGRGECAAARLVPLLETALLLLQLMIDVVSVGMNVQCLRRCRRGW